MLRFPLLRSAGILCAAPIALGVASAAAADCKAVRGHYEETALVGPQCTSPVGLCTTAQLFGPFKGNALFTASAIIPSADTPTTGVVFVTGNTTVSDARLGNRQGTLFL